jgi:hypothetical protein
VASDRAEQSSAPAESGRSSRSRSVLKAFFDRRQHAWDRVHELEERAEAPNFKRANEALKQALELAKANDVAGLRRLNEEQEQNRQEQERVVAEAAKARRRLMLRIELPLAAIGLAVLLVIAAFNSLWLGALDVDYIDSYLQDGFQVSLLFTVVGYLISLDTRKGLIAVHPGLYAAEVFTLLSGVSAAVGTVFGSPRSDRALAKDGLQFLGSRFRPKAVDLVLSWLFTLSFGAAMLAWIVLIAPLQYWVNLVSGAPVREALASSRTLWLLDSPNRIEFISAPKDPNEYQQHELEKAREQGKLIEIGFAATPVTATSGIATAVLFGISQLI